MKSLLRNTVFNSISIYLLALFIPGVKIIGGLEVFIISGFILTVLFKILKPILEIFSIPFNIISLGLFSFFLNTILLYLLTIFVPNISVNQFTFSGYEFAGFIIPVMHFGSFWAHVITAGLLAFLMNFFNWLTK